MSKDTIISAIKQAATIPNEELRVREVERFALQLVDEVQRDAWAILTQIMGQILQEREKERI